MSEKSSQQQQATITAVLALFLMGDDQEAAFASAIYAAQVQSAQDAYDAAAADLGIETDATLPDSVLSTLAEQSQESAASIVQTYNTSITAEAERATDAYSGDPAGLEAALERDLASWAEQRASWKAAQIASYESGRGYSAGIDWLISDLQSGDLALPDDASLSDLVITVLPEESSPDSACAPYAGNSYSLDNADEVMGRFPAHANCIHYYTLDYAA